MKLWRCAVAWAAWARAATVYAWCNAGHRKFCMQCDRAVWWFHRTHCGWFYYKTQLSQAERDELQAICDRYWQRRRSMPSK